MTEVIRDTIPSYRCNFLPERYNENLSRPTEITLNENDQVLKKINLIE